MFGFRRKKTLGPAGRDGANSLLLIFVSLALTALLGCQDFDRTAEKYLTSEPPDPARFQLKSDWGVLDAKTGLIWEQKTKENYQTAMTWEEARQYVRELELGGYSDWRLPRTYELKDLFDQNYVPTIHPKIFRYIQPWCWASKKDLLSSEAYYADFTSGLIKKAHRTTAFPVRAVRKP